MSEVVSFENCNTNETCNIIIDENKNEEFSSYLWDSSFQLSNFIFNNKSLFFGKKVLELGSGVDLCGIMCSLCGSFVYFSDRSDVKEIKEKLLHNCELNNLNEEDYEIVLNQIST